MCCLENHSSSPKRTSIALIFDARWRLGRKVKCKTRNVRLQSQRFDGLPCSSRIFLASVEMHTDANLFNGVALSSQPSSYRSQITNPAANWPPIWCSRVCPNSYANPSFAIVSFFSSERLFRSEYGKGYF